MVKSVVCIISCPNISVVHGLGYTVSNGMHHERANRVCTFPVKIFVHACHILKQAEKVVFIKLAGRASILKI